MLTFSRYTIGAVLALVTCVALHAAEPGFTPLLDEGHTDGWSYLGDGAMKVTDGVATTSQQHNPESGLYWYQSRTFADFTLKLEFKVDTATSNSGVYLRFPDPGNDYKVAEDKGYEIDIYGEKTGTIIFLNTKLRPAKPTPIKPGAWNEMTVTVAGQKYTVEVNGQVVNEFLGNRARSGFIGLQTFHGGGDVHFRNVQIKDLSADNTMPAPAVAEQKPVPSKQIEPLLDPSLDAVLAPLDKDPQMPRVAVEKLRASLSGGAVQAKTPAQKQIFQCAISVCDALVNGMDERAQVRAQAMASGQVPSVSNGGSIVNTMPLRGWDAGHAGDAVRKKQADERRYADQKAGQFSAFMESSAYKAWVTKSATLREGVMSIYTKLVQLEAADAVAK